MKTNSIPNTIDDSDCDRRITLAKLETADKSRNELWTQYLRDRDDQTRPDQPYAELQVLTFIRAIYSKRQLVELLADFWHNHFNVQGSQNLVQTMIMRYDRDVIRGAFAR